MNMERETRIAQRELRDKLWYREGFRDGLVIGGCGAVVFFSAIALLSKGWQAVGMCLRLL